MAGNLDPKTAAFTTAAMLLGAEEYPSTIQNTEVNNTGYLLYGAKLLISETTPYQVDGNGTRYSRVLMNTAGLYDLYPGVVAERIGALSGVYTLSANGTVILTGTVNAAATHHTGTTSNFIPAVDWNDFRLSLSTGGGTCAVRNWGVFARQING